MPKNRKNNYLQKLKREIEKDEDFLRWARRERKKINRQQRKIEKDDINDIYKGF